MKRLRRILLVDDDPINNFIVERLFIKMNVADEICIFQSSIKALDFVSECIRENNCPELVLVDNNMPAMDGFEFVRKFKSLDFPGKEKVMFAMLTTLNNLKDISVLDELNIQCLVNKPLTEEIALDLFRKREMYF